ncbi:MAG TPA: zf-HC2 domain-containing protein [Pyrinomonadaceae bacterium]|nr:zf-HC2 domain-containing protein [Pyrinomonadaceae bacterium]
MSKVATENSSSIDAENCIEPEQGVRVYEYYNGMLAGDDAQDFRAHLLVCFGCRQTIMKLDRINEILKVSLSESAPSDAAANKPERKRVKVKSASGGNT